jgi:hypothetical protein
MACFIARGWRGQALNLDDDDCAPTDYFGGIVNSLEQALKVWQVLTDPPLPNSPMKQVFVPELNRNTLEAELFGTAVGGFTGCVRNRAGAFLAAGTGVLFLDEFLELPAEEQTRFLGALGTSRVQPTGHNRPEYYVCRVIAATNKAVTQEELDDLVDQGLIRRDVMARFSRTYELPPLGERMFEIVPLLMSLLGRRTKIEPEQMQFRISAPALKVVATHAMSANVRALDALATRVPQTVVNSYKDESARPVGKHGPFLSLKHLGSLGVRECAKTDEFTPPESVVFQFTLSADCERDPADIAKEEDHIPDTEYFKFLQRDETQKMITTMANVVKERITNEAVASIDRTGKSDDFIESVFGDGIGTLRSPLLEFYNKLIELRAEKVVLDKALEEALSKSNSVLERMPFYHTFRLYPAIKGHVLKHLEEAVSKEKPKSKHSEEAVSNEKVKKNYLYNPDQKPGRPPNPIKADLLLNILTGRL